jgi:hypothetical protein
MPARANPLTNLRQRAIDSPATALVVFVATIYLAALPTVYTVLAAGLDPTKSDAAGWRRPAFLLFAAWVLCALVLGGVAFLKDSQMQTLIDYVRPRQIRQGNRRRDAVLRAITLLLENGREAKLLQSFDPRIFIASPPEGPNELIPLLRADVHPWQRWPLGTGAIGYTYQLDSADPLVFRRKELAKLNLSLTGEQIEHYEQVTMVAAIVIRDDAEDPLGVLSVSSTAHAPNFGEKRLKALKLLAGNLGVFLELVV